MIYKIQMKKSDFFKINSKIISSNLEIIGDDVVFEVEGGSFNILKKTGYDYILVESLKSKVLKFFSHYGLVITGILFLLSVLYINVYRVSKIEFNRKTPINDEIEYRIKSSFKTLFCFDFCSLNYDDFSVQMQKKYYTYPYISVTCQNNVINVFIANVDDVTYDVESHLEGNIVAKKTGIVDSFYTYNGKNLVSKNQYVKQGDILIEGSPRVSGLVMGTTYDKIELVIRKKINLVEVLDDVGVYYNLKLFGFNFNIAKNHDFSLYNSSEDVVFNLFDFFSLKKIEETKKNAIIKTYSNEEALEEAKNKIYSDFDEHKINDLEKILGITLIKEVDNSEDYTFTFIVKKYESLGVFSEE